MLTELLVIPRNGTPYRCPLSPVLTIGRSTDNTICVADEFVSMRHASIRQQQDDWILEDLSSVNGTYLNGVRVLSPTSLSDSDRIAIGGFQVICMGAPSVGDADKIPAASPPSPLRAIPGTLVFPGFKSTVTIVDPTPFTYGRTSVLLRASDDDGTEVCVKLFPQIEGDNWDNVAAFEREIRVQRSLEHPHILSVLDYGLSSEPNGSPFVVLPFCAGGNFRGLLRDRAFYSLQSMLPLLDQVAEALDFAHSSGFIHGDVKPENMLLSGDRTEVFLSDFGMSNVFAIQERFTTAVRGPQGGTTAYLSPEQVSKNQQTPLSDVYAFAVTAYEMLTGRLPFDQNLPTFAQMMAKVNGEALDPQQFNPRLTEKTSAALFAGLHIDPLKRPRSAASLCRLLAESDSILPMKLQAAQQHKRNVFISYSHRDTEWLDRVRIHLRPLERQGHIELWDDTRIRPGMQWRGEIARALEEACSAVLLVSPDFLASEFCVEQELLTLLRSAEERGVSILPLILSPCEFASTPRLSAFQAVNDPARTLIEMPRGEQERVLTSLAATIRASLGGGEDRT